MKKRHILNSDNLYKYCSLFQKDDNELYRNAVDNAHAAEFLEDRVPFFSCPDLELEKTYYFRWWTYRKHMRMVNGKYVITEFLPDVNWAGTYNSIIFSAGQHLMEGRWLRDDKIMQDYGRFWYCECEKARPYSETIPFSIEQLCKVRGDYSWINDVLERMAQSYRNREIGVPAFNHYTCKEFTISKEDCGLIYSTDDMDGGEYSVGGTGYRPYCNCAAYGNAVAISNMAKNLGMTELATEFEEKAQNLKRAIETQLWNEKDGFFEVLWKDKGLSGARELYGYMPWYVSMGNDRYASGWELVTKNDGFRAPYGLTYLEQSHHEFQLGYTGHECKWDGPVWPYATSITLTAMANYINDSANPLVTKQDYFDLLTQYAYSHRRIDETGKQIMWLDENLNPYTGDWISRTILQSDARKDFSERGKDYNHSTFCDLIISGLVGLRPSNGNELTVSPLLPENAWDYFCLDGVKYHGREICVSWDRNGDKYGNGKGLSVWVDGKLSAQTDKLETLKINL